MENPGIWTAFLAIVAMGLIIRLVTYVRRKSSPVVGTWDGDIVAAVVTLARHARLKGDDDPQAGALIIRRRSTGTEHKVWVGRSSHLPKPVKKQVFGQSLVINVYEPNFALPRAEKRQAIAQAKNGGYRFDLAQHVPVSVEENQRGNLHWTLAD